MEIERLSFLVSPSYKVDDFVDADRKIWEPWLQQQRGYIRKTVQIYPDGRVDLRIFWASKRDLEKASKDPQIPALDVKLRAEFLGVYQKLP